MTEADLPAVSQIFISANPQENPTGIWQYSVPILQKFPQLCWVAEESLSGELIGGITGSIIEERNVGYVVDIAVDPGFQDRGWGDRLIQQEIQAFAKMEINMIELLIHFLNARVVPFYSRYGFRLQAVKLDAFGPGHDAIGMVSTPH